MESVETTLRRLKPQPLATASAGQFAEWRKAILEQVQHIDATRTENHPIEVRLKNLVAFMEQQLALITRTKGAEIVLHAGEFYWLLVRLEQRQEGMKAQIAVNDPFMTLIWPKKAGL